MSVAASFALSVTLFYVSRLRVVWEPSTVGCLPMCCSLIHCMAACNCEGGLLSAISGILVGGILGFGAAEWFVLLDTFARSCTVVWCFSFVSVQDLNSLAQMLPVFPCGLVSASSAGFCVFWFGCVALFCFVWFVGPDKTSDCVTVRTLLSTPQGGTLKLHLDNSFISTTMCDDLARATEAQDGKKKMVLVFCLLGLTRLRTDARAHKARRIATARKSPEEWVAELIASRTRFLATTAVPDDPVGAVQGGLLLTPLAGAIAKTPLDWAHAWAILGEWAGVVAFPIPENGEWKRHGDGRYLRPEYAERTPPFLTWARPIFEQGALSPMAVLPAEFPIICLPGDKLFQSKEVAEGYSLPPVVHAFHGNKAALGQKLATWQEVGLQPLAVTLLGTEKAPPLWTHPMGCDFVRGTRIVAKSHVTQERKLTELQVLLLQCLWTPIGTPNDRNEEVPWPPNTATIEVMCGQQASLKLPTQKIEPLLQALRQKLGLDTSKAELVVSDFILGRPQQPTVLPMAAHRHESCCLATQSH